jgi:transposase
VDEQPAGHAPGRPPVLDEARRRTIIALLMNGSSRRMAAAYVGCSPSTITRTAARDPEFAARLARAEGSAETEALALIRKAARKERYWRAAAWYLERRNPTDFAPCKRDVVTEDRLRRMLGSLATLVVKDISEEKFEQILDRLDQIRLAEEQDFLDLAENANGAPLPPAAAAVRWGGSCTAAPGMAVQLPSQRLDDACVGSPPTPD